MIYKIAASVWLISLITVGSTAIADLQSDTAKIGAAPVSVSSDPTKDFSLIDKFQAEVEAGFPPCTQAQWQSKSAATQQRCKLVKWAQEEFTDYPHCSRFFIEPGEKGKVGDLGKMIARMVGEDIRQNRDASVFMQNYADFDAPNRCPGFKNFTPDMKVAFYTWIYELTAFAESSCNPNVKNNTDNDVPNGPAVCMYQMELAPELRSWRGPNCKSLSKEAIMTPEGCTACAFDVLKGSMNRNKAPFGILNKEKTKRIAGSYWHSHNPMPEAEHIAGLTKYLACKEKNPKVYKKVCSLDPRIKFYERLGGFPGCDRETPVKK
jgi:hypothetical protein